MSPNVAVDVPGSGPQSTVPDRRHAGDNRPVTDLPEVVTTGSVRGPLWSVTGSRPETANLGGNGGIVSGPYFGGVWEVEDETRGRRLIYKKDRETDVSTSQYTLLERN